MDIRFSPEDEAFRGEVREFLETELPEDLRHKVENGIELKRDDLIGWHRILYRRGWVAPNWPKEHGGPGWTLTRKYIFDEECGLAGAPRIVSFGINMCGPVLIRFGTEEQRRRFLPRIARGELAFAIGMSEPDSGSDLASIRTRAERADGGYRVNGTKVWTSNAHLSDYMIALFRTEVVPGKKHEGLTQFLVDLRTTKGITIRPIIDLAGHHHFNEVNFTDAFIPEDMRLGNDGDGWKQVTTELAFVAGRHLVRVGNPPIGRVQEDCLVVAGERAGRIQLREELAVDHRSVPEQRLGGQPALTRSRIRHGDRELCHEGVGEHALPGVDIEPIEPELLVEHPVPGANDGSRADAVREADTRLDKHRRLLPKARHVVGIAEGHLQLQRRLPFAARVVLGRLGALEILHLLVVPSPCLRAEDPVLPGRLRLVVLARVPQRGVGDLVGEHARQLRVRPLIAVIHVGEIGPWRVLARIEPADRCAIGRAIGRTRARQVLRVRLPGQPRRLARPGELGPFGQEAVTGMDGVGAGVDGGVDDHVTPQVALPDR